MKSTLELKFETSGKNKNAKKEMYLQNENKRCGILSRSVSLIEKYRDFYNI